MKVFYSLFLIFFSISLFAQPSTDYSIQAWAEIDASAPQITIHWVGISDALNYSIYRKEKEESYWGSVPLATVDGNSNLYLDTDIIEGISYEYKIQKSGNNVAYGYINSGINIPADHNKGRILLLVDNLFIDSLSTELDQLTDDLIGDGWQVNREDIDRESSVVSVKNIVISINNSETEPLDAIYCIGHIPVPYSGNYAPDGHPDHKGAWPADGFYADINGNWTDEFVNNTDASQDRHDNIPGDGKYDQLKFPSEVEIQIGRIDFANMSAFSLSEGELLRQYLNKSHAFKIGDIQVEMKGVIDDNFGGFGGEAFAGSAWKSFGPMLHPDNVNAGDYRTSMDTSSYMWSYGCGGGSYSSCNGIGTTNDIAGDSLQGIFSMMFGSYFGDWDSPNNILRAPLAQGTILTNCWSGRPHWYFHHMGLGENIGYSTRLSMNNAGVFYNTPLSFLGGIISMGLMGDPSLKMHIIKPVSDLSVNFNGFDTEITWTASPDENDGYYVYRSDNIANYFTLLNEEPTTLLGYSDNCVSESGNYTYMVRTTRLELTPSGSFQNLSTGITIDVDLYVTYPIANFSVESNEGTITISNSSLNVDNGYWDFGDNETSFEYEPTHTYLESGNYDITLIVFNSCFIDTLVLSTEIITEINSITKENNISVSPNPSKDFFKLKSANSLKDIKIQLTNVLGVEIKTFVETSNKLVFSLEFLPTGIYFLHLEKGSKTDIIKLIKK